MILTNIHIDLEVEIIFVNKFDLNFAKIRNINRY